MGEADTVKGRKKKPNFLQYGWSPGDMPKVLFHNLQLCLLQTLKGGGRVGSLFKACL